VELLREACAPKARTFIAATSADEEKIEINHEGHEEHEERKKKTKRRMREVVGNSHTSHPSFLRVLRGSFLLFIIRTGGNFYAH
jgi:hypothetical protein